MVLETSSVYDDNTDNNCTAVSFSCDVASSSKRCSCSTTNEEVVVASSIDKVHKRRRWVVTVDTANVCNVFIAVKTPFTLLASTLFDRAAVMVVIAVLRTSLKVSVANSYGLLEMASRKPDQA